LDYLFIEFRLLIIKLQ